MDACTGYLPAKCFQIVEKSKRETKENDDADALLQLQ